MFLSVTVAFSIILVFILLQFHRSIRNNERGYSCKVRSVETSNARQKLYEVGVSTVERGALYYYSCIDNKYLAVRCMA